MSLVGGSIERRPSTLSQRQEGHVQAFGVLDKDSGKVFTTRFYGGKLEHSLALLEEQSTPIQAQDSDGDADDDFEEVESDLGEECEENTGESFLRVASNVCRIFKLSSWFPQFGQTSSTDKRDKGETEESLDGGADAEEDNGEEDRLASVRGNKILVGRTMALLVVSVTDVIFALGMHAAPEETAMFGDLHVLSGRDIPAVTILFVLVIAFYWFDLFLTLVSRDSGGVTVGKAFFTDRKLGVAGSLGARIWRFLILTLSTLVFFLLNFGNLNDLDRLHGTLHVLRAVNAMTRLFHMKDEITQQLKVTVSQNKRRFIDRRLDVDLDLTYICDRVIAMSLPCVSDAVYRNDIDAVSRFFRGLHYGCFLVVNLCQHFEERGNGNYDASVLFNQVQKVPCVDHNAPMMHQLLDYCERATSWLDRHSDNVISVHCQGGKGRTGTFIVGLLLWVGRFNNPTEAVKYVQNRRADARLGSIYQGVSSPSQLRMIGYLISVIYCATCHATLANALLTRIVIRNFPRSVSKGGALSLMVEADGERVYDYGKAKGLLYEDDQHDAEDLEDFELYCNYEFLLDRPLLLDRDAVVRIYRFLPTEAAKFVPCGGTVQGGAHEVRYGRVSGKQVSFCAFHPGFHAEGPISFNREQIDKSHNNPEFPDSYSLHLSFEKGIPNAASDTRENTISGPKLKARSYMTGQSSFRFGLGGEAVSPPRGQQSPGGTPRFAKGHSFRFGLGGASPANSPPRPSPNVHDQKSFSGSDEMSETSHRPMRRKTMEFRDVNAAFLDKSRFAMKTGVHQVSFLDEGLKTDWSIMLVRRRQALAQVISRQCKEPLVFGREDLVYDFAPDERDIRRVYFITHGCVVHRRRSKLQAPTRIINNGESCDGIFIGAGECYGVVPFLFGSSFEKTNSDLRAWSNRVEVRYLELEDEEMTDSSVLFKGLSELESAMVMRAIVIQVLREEQRVNGLTAVANLRRVEKTHQHKERFRRGRSAIVADTMTKCQIPASHALRYFSESRRQSSKGQFISGYVLIFKYHFVFRPHAGSHDVVLDLRDLSRVHSNGSMLQMLAVVSRGDAGQYGEPAAPSSPVFRSAQGSYPRGSAIKSVISDARRRGPSLPGGSFSGDWLKRTKSPAHRGVPKSITKGWFSGKHVQTASSFEDSGEPVTPRSHSSFGSILREGHATSSSTGHVTSSMEFEAQSISGCREMRASIQSVLDEIKESRRLKIISTDPEHQEGPFGADPRKSLTSLRSMQSSAEDSILMRMHQLCVDKVFLPGECIVRHGDTGRDIYYIVSGAVNGEVGGKLVEKLTSGDLIGDRGFFSSGNSGCRATAIAQTETECLIITPEVVKMLEQHEPKQAARFYRGLATAVAIRLYHAIANVYALSKN